MQGQAKISVAQVGDVIDAVFAQGNPLVYESYSEPEEELRSFDSPLPLEAEIEMRVPAERRSLLYSIYYPEAKGLVKKTRIQLIPEKNTGKRFRFSADGWGLIQLQLTFGDSDVSCRIAVNSEKRALSWFGTYPDHGDPQLWEWKIVEKHARRIIRALKKPNQSPEPTSGLRPAVAHL
jgi:hypothetical protein